MGNKEIKRTFSSCERQFKVENIKGVLDEYIHRMFDAKEQLLNTMLYEKTQKILELNKEIANLQEEKRQFSFHNKSFLTDIHEILAVLKEIVSEDLILVTRLKGVSWNCKNINNFLIYFKVNNKFYVDITFSVNIIGVVIRRINGYTSNTEIFARSYTKLDEFYKDIKTYNEIITDKKRLFNCISNESIDVVEDKRAIISLLCYFDEINFALFKEIISNYKRNSQFVYNLSEEKYFSIWNDISSLNEVKKQRNEKNEECIVFDMMFLLRTGGLF